MNNRCQSLKILLTLPRTVIHTNYHSFELYQFKVYMHTVQILGESEVLEYCLELMQI